MCSNTSVCACTHERDLFDELLAECTGGAEALLLQRHVLLGLRVKAGVLDQAVHKQPHVVLHLKQIHANVKLNGSPNMAQVKMLVN